MKALAFYLCLLPALCSAQLCYNKSSIITIQDSALVYVMGSYENDSTAGLYNGGRLYLDSNFINYSSSAAQRSGKYFVKGDWINSASFVCDSSKVFLWGANQFIKGTSVTTFWDLLCQSSGPKELGINARVKDSLVFEALEIKTHNDTLFFDNTAASALSYDSTFAAEGYISNDTLGAFTRVITGTGRYIYPMGNTAFYRPLAFSNASGSAGNTTSVAVSFNHYNASLKGYNTSLKDPGLCKVDSDFYHEVKGWQNNDYTISYYFYKPTDHRWNTIGEWDAGNTDWKEINQSVGAQGSNGYYSWVRKDSFNINQYYPIALADKYPYVASISGKDTNCLKDNVNLSSLVSPSSDYEFYWTSTGPHTFSNQDSVHQVASIVYTSAGSYQVSFVLVDTAYGCANLTHTTSVFVDAGPQAGFNVVTSPIYDNIPVQLSDQSAGALTWFYDLGNGYTSNQQNPQAVYFTDGTITITQIVTDKYGCKDSVMKTITIGDGIVIPNIFTPNGDGINDQFLIKGGGIKSYELEIITRWGETVFKGNEGSAAWDGTTPSGTACSEGTYFYVLSITFSSVGKKDYKGFLTLTR